MGPAALFEDTDADIRMLLGGWMALVVEVMQQSGGGVEVDEGLSIVANEAETPRLLYAVGVDAAFDGECVLEQAGALGEFIEQGPCRLT
jgi:hypothetical protein